MRAGTPILESSKPAVSNSLDQTREPALSVVSRRTEHVLARLAWMRAEDVWPAGLRDLWTDAFGLVLLVSLHRASGAADPLDEARRLVAAVERVLRPGVEPLSHLALWTFALGRLARIEPEFRRRAVELAREGHARLARGGAEIGRAHV